VECQIGAWPQWWVPPQKFVRTRFSYSEPRKVKCVRFGLAANVVIFITNLIKCILELTHADRHDLPYVFFTFSAFRERAIQFKQCRVYVPPRRKEPLRRYYV